MGQQLQSLDATGYGLPAIAVLSQPLIVQIKTEAFDDAMAIVHSVLAIKVEALSALSIHSTHMEYLHRSRRA